VKWGVERYRPAPPGPYATRATSSSFYIAAPASRDGDDWCTVRGMSEPRQVVDIADAWAEREPERVCLTFHPEGRPPVPVTYGSLRADVLAWAIGLARVAIQPGAPIVLPLHAGRRVPQPNLEGGRALPSGGARDSADLSRIVRRKPLSPRLSVPCSLARGRLRALCADPGALAGPLRRVLHCGHAPVPTRRPGVPGRWRGTRNMLWSAYVRDWPVVDMKPDWKRVFPYERP
jgi:hypothetical protein